MPDLKLKHVLVVLYSGDWLYNTHAVFPSVSEDESLCYHFFQNVVQVCYTWSDVLLIYSITNLIDFSAEHLIRHDDINKLINMLLYNRH